MRGVQRDGAVAKPSKLAREITSSLSKTNHHHVERAICRLHENDLHLGTELGQDVIMNALFDLHPWRQTTFKPAQLSDSLRNLQTDIPLQAQHQFERRKPRRNIKRTEARI